MNFWLHRPAAALVAVLAIISSFLVFAEVPVNLADVDPLEDCNRREVKCM